MDHDKLEELTTKQFDSLFIQLHKKIINDPIKNFVEAPGFINTILAPGQRVLFKLVMGQALDYETEYDCLEEFEDEELAFALRSVKMTEVELYEYMTEKPYDPETLDIVRDITLIVGRRGGKTLCAAILAIYCSLKKNWKPMLGRKKTATILVVSHTKEFSEETIDEVRAMLEDSPVLSRLVNKKAKNTQSTINLKIPFLNEKGKIIYSYVRIRSNAASSKSSRGSACPVIICDEIAFWGSDPNSKETDKEIVRAIKPSMLQFEDDALWIELSTPNTKHGVLYEKYDKRFELSKRAVLLKAPSWVFNNRYRAIDFHDFWLEDPENFEREFRANFVDTLGSFFNPDFVDMAVLKGVHVLPAAPKSESVKYICAVDAAFKGDIFTVNVVGLHENRIKQYATIGFKGNRKTPIKSSEVAAAVRELNKQYDFEIVYADQFSFQPLKEIFAQYNLILEERTFTNVFKQKIFKNLKYLIEAQQLDLLDHAQTVKELKEIQVEISSTGRIKILHPPGGHDDYADSLAIAAFIAKEQAGELGISFESAMPQKDYGVPRDRDGTCFTAPPPEILSESYDYEIFDNSDEFTIDPETGKLVRESELDEDDGDDSSFAF